MDALRNQPRRTLTAGDLANIADFPLGNATISPSRRKVSGPLGSSDLQPRVMQVLVLLAQAAGQVVSRETLLDCCWGGVYVGDDSLNRVVAALRKCAVETAGASFEIETVPRVGYRLVVPDGRGPEQRPSRRYSRSAIAVVLLLAVAAVAFVAIRNAGGTAQQPQVAVLSFTPLDADPGTTALARSIGASVANALAQTGARIPDNVRGIDDARKSGAALIVSGTVQHDGPSYRVTARVDSGPGGATIMSNEFQVDPGRVPGLTGTVAAWLTPAVRMWSSFLPVESDRRVNEEILRIFLTRQSGDGLRAWELSRSLAASKPGSGAAQLVNALLTSDVLGLIEQNQRQSAVETALRSAANAARLLPDPARVYAVRDCHLIAPGWQVLTPRCDQQTRAAVSANPDVPLLPFLFAAQLIDSGRFNEAIKFADMDLAQAPIGLGQLSVRILAARMAQSSDEDGRLPQLEDRLRRYGGPGSLGYSDFRVALANGDIQKAAALIDSAAGDEIATGEAKATLRAVFRAVSSRSAEDSAEMRQRCIPEQADSAPTEFAFPACLVGLTLVNDLDDAFVVADRGYRDVDCCTPAEQQRQWLASAGQYNSRMELFGKAMTSFRADPRFIEVARRTGLLSYWKSGHAPDFCLVEHSPVCGLLRGGPSHT